MTPEEVIQAFRRPPRLWSRSELIVRDCPIPTAQGIYGWYFDELPHESITGIGTVFGGRSLLYIGIAPGRPGSASNLRKRLRNHLTGNARGSTLRLSIGALIAARFGLEAVPRSGGIHFGTGEAAISAWLDAHARVSWFECPEPWQVESEVVRALGVPLNRQHNQSHPFFQPMGELRRNVSRTGLTPSE